MKCNILTAGLIMACYNNASIASSTLTSLKVDGDIVYFSTKQAKGEVSPSCMLDEFKNDWSVSLKNTTGKAIYSMLVAATATQKSIIVKTANDCAIKSGYERARSVEISSEPGTLNNGQFYLYSGDGQRIGVIAELKDLSEGYVSYISDEDLDNDEVRQLYSVKMPRYSKYWRYFTQSNCQGDVMFESAIGEIGTQFAIKNFNDGKFISLNSTRRSYSASLSRNGDDCENYSQSNSFNGFTPSLHPVCGDSPCKIRVE